MNGIVIYYSLFGNNKKKAEQLAKDKNYEIHEFSPGSIFRVFQFFFGKNKLKKKAQELNNKVSDYSNVVICGPIWAKKPAPAINSLLTELNLQDKNVEFHFTYTQDYGITEDSIIKMIDHKSAVLQDITFSNISEKKGSIN
jgi:hypothetical protein